MGFERNNDIETPRTPPPEQTNKFDLSDSDEIAAQLHSNEVDGLDADEPDVEPAVDTDDPLTDEEIDEDDGFANETEAEVVDDPLMDEEFEDDEIEDEPVSEIEDDPLVDEEIPDDPEVETEEVAQDDPLVDEEIPDDPEVEQEPGKEDDPVTDEEIPEDYEAGLESPRENPEPMKAETEEYPQPKPPAEEPFKAETLAVERAEPMQEQQPDNQSAASDQARLVENKDDIVSGNENDVVKPPEPAKQQQAPELDSAPEPYSDEAQYSNDSASPETGSGTQAQDVAIDEKERFASAFSKENFRTEDSFDAYVKENYPELNELKSKCVYEVQPMGTPDSEIDRSNNDVYTDDERQYLKDVRDSVDAPTESTVMQKVVGVDTGDIQKDLDKYLNPYDFDGNACESHVTGYVAKAEDAAPFTGTPQQCFYNMRLDYPDTQYQSPDQSVYVIRFTDGNNYDIPYSKEFDGYTENDQPFTGNGFVAAKDTVTPEYTVHPQEKKGAIVTDGVIYRVNPDGFEEIVATYNKKDRCFDLFEKEEYQ